MGGIGSMGMGSASDISGPIQWHQAVSMCPDMPMVVIGNKSDLKEERADGSKARRRPSPTLPARPPVRPRGRYAFASACKVHATGAEPRRKKGCAVASLHAAPACRATATTQLVLAKCSLARCARDAPHHSHRATWPRGHCTARTCARPDQAAHRPRLG